MYHLSDARIKKGYREWLHVSLKWCTNKERIQGMNTCIT